MKRASGIFLVVVFLTGLTGCKTPLDQRQLELIQNWGTANQAFATAIEVYQGKMRKIMDTQFEDQRKQKHLVWQQFLAMNSVDGVLVETDENDQIVIGTDGQPQPMRRAALERELEYFWKELAQIDENEEIYHAVDQELTRAIAVFREMNVRGVETSEDILEARRSAQRLMESALSALAGVAAGLGVGAAIAP